MSTVTVACPRSCGPGRPHRFAGYEEIARAVRAEAGSGVRKLPVTGGEPLARHDVLFFIRQLRQISGIENIFPPTAAARGLIEAPAGSQASESGLHANDPNGARFPGLLTASRRMTAIGS